MNKLTEIIKASVRLVREAMLAKHNEIVEAKSISNHKNHMERFRNNAATHARLSKNPHYDEARNIALKIISGKSSEVISSDYTFEAVELAQEMICALSSDTDKDICDLKRVPDSVLSIGNFRAILILSNLSEATDWVSDATEYPLIIGYKILADHRNTLAPQIAALRIQHDMKQRIDAGTAIPGAEAAIEAPVGTRRRMGTI